MASPFVRRAGLVVIGGGAYAGTSLLVYNYMTSGLQEQEEVQKELSSLEMHSYVKDPHRVDRFQSIADIYDSQIGRDEAFMGINVLRRALLYFHAKGTVLEVGAGTGRNLPYYPKKAVDRVILSDSSDQMLQQAREKIQRLPVAQRSRFACLEADAAELLDFADDSFDCVVDTFGLCSFDDPAAVLQEMARVCKPGGKILLLEHGRSKSWLSLSSYLDKNAERHAKNWGCIWNRDLDAILESVASLDVDRVDTWHFGTTYYVVCRPRKKDATSISSQEMLAKIIV
jgi:methyltransferase OMS1